jgi:antitoxin component of RelBE/YafQ-DinJ toxin-antitoxin module
MTKTDTIRARIEPKLKAKAEGILSSLGKLIGVSSFFGKKNSH